MKNKTPVQKKSINQNEVTSAMCNLLNWPATHKNHYFEHDQQWDPSRPVYLLIQAYSYFSTCLADEAFECAKSGIQKADTERLAMLNTQRSLVQSLLAALPNSSKLCGDTEHTLGVKLFRDDATIADSEAFSIINNHAGV